MTSPRLAPPLPLKSAIAEAKKIARICGIKLLDSQIVALTYMTALDRRKRWLYPEYAEVMSRQNGKTTKLPVRIVMGLLRGEKIMHTAQNRELPRAVYHQVAAVMETKYPELLAHRPRYANGQELIEMRNGGRYRVVAPNTSGARGYDNDLVIIDEARELTTFDFIGAARPTLAASRNPQTIYLSNAGDEASVVLNALRARASSDPELVYLEWSAHPDRAADDMAGWAEANPALGQLVSLSTLETAYRQLPLPVFETEHLCRWVTTTMPRVVTDLAWQRARQEIGDPVRPSMAFAVDPEGRRVSAVIAWVVDTFVYVHTLADVTGSPVDLDAIAKALLPEMRKLGIRAPGHDPWTDRDLARYFKDAQAVNGADYEAACERFVRSVEGGKLRHADSAELSADISYTVRRTTGHGWMAVRASAERPTTATLAAIRAVYLATADKPAAPRVR